MLVFGWFSLCIVAINILIFKYTIKFKYSVIVVSNGYGMGRVQ